MALRIEAALRVTTLDGTPIVEATESRVIHHRPDVDNAQDEIAEASPEAQQVVERVRASFDTQIAKTLSVTEE
jgi:hypothetical protein